MHHLTMGTIVVYYTTIILNRLNKVANYIIFKVFKSELT